MEGVQVEVGVSICWLVGVILHGAGPRMVEEVVPVVLMVEERRRVVDLHGFVCSSTSI